jgi:hypothetical protein
MSKDMQTKRLEFIDEANNFLSLVAVDLTQLAWTLGEGERAAGLQGLASIASEIRLRGAIAAMPADSVGFDSRPTDKLKALEAEYAAALAKIDRILRSLDPDDSELFTGDSLAIAALIERVKGLVCDLATTAAALPPPKVPKVTCAGLTIAVESCTDVCADARIEEMRARLAVVDPDWRPEGCS